MKKEKITDVEEIISKDPEAAMSKDLQKKRAMATKTFEVARKEFSEWYTSIVPTGVIPWHEPAISWMFAGWVAGESPREWLSEEDKEALEKKKQAFKKSAETRKENKKKRDAL
jgi:hypothetical protein